MSIMSELPPTEDPGIDPKNKNLEENESKDPSDAATEPAMLEEEEMPSYISLNSLPITEETATASNIARESRHLQGEEERASSPCTSEQGAESICVLSSGEESDRRPYAMEDYDSEEMDMEEEEEEEEDDDDSCMNDEEEDSDGDIEPEQFERSSDDFVLRYDGGLEKHHKERSRSLQDLTNSRGNLSRFVGKRRSIDFMGSYEPEFPFQTVQGPIQDPLAIRKKISRPVKYDHVPSKVKLYIQEIKEQKRSSAERTNRENPLHKNDARPSVDNSDTSRARLNPTGKKIKSYVQNAINEIELKERSGIVEDSNYVRPIEDRADIVVMNKIEEIKEIDEPEKKLQSAAVPENLALSSENPGKKIRPNGLVDHSANDKIVEPMEIHESNGQEAIATIFNLRSMSYEEYTNGGEPSKNTVENFSRSKCPEDNENVKYPDSLVAVTQGEVLKRPSTSKKEEIKLLPNEVPEPYDGWNLRELTFEETARRKTAQVDRDAYQKTLDENIRLKLDLEKMRKTLEQCRADSRPNEDHERTLAENANLKRELKEMRKKFEQYRTDNEPAEMKVASVQTEIENCVKTAVIIDESKQTSITNKLMSSSATSALSSIVQWSDSNCSPAISIDPPNIENVLNSDDSFALGERPAAKTPRALSHSFVTSSRILQTLANITQGRTRTAGQSPSGLERKNYHLNTEQQGQSKRQNNDPILSENEEANNTSRAKKRKASDMLGLSGNLDSFKIPHTPADTRRKISSDSAADGEFKTAEERDTNTREKGDERMEESSERRSDDADDNESTSEPKDVKYFVYHDEPDSKERSFLIQADDSTKNSETLDRGGNVRECGPFLLGNVEIRMSEANGTINIWGKEINQSVEDPGVEVDTDDSGLNERPSFDPRSPFVCQSTPHLKCQNVNTSGSSSAKKSRISPKFSRSGIGKYLRSAATNLTRTNAHGNIGHSGNCGASPILDNDRTNECDHCESRQRRGNLSSCEHIPESRIKRHSCCLHNVEINERDCGCESDNEVFDDSTMYENISNILANHDKCNNLLNKPTTSKHYHVNVANEEICRSQTSHCRRRSSAQDFYSAKKRCTSRAADLPSCSNRLTPVAHCCHDNTTRSRSHVSCDDEAHPLLSNDEHSETPETKRRRLSGKRVRGILTDLLRGCGGCRQPNSTTSLPRVDLQNCIPKVQVTPCSPAQESCSKRTNGCSCQTNHRSADVSNEKCCNSCTRRTEMRAEIENQLEIFRVAMEQLRSRSDAVLEMLHLLNAETD